MTPAYVYTQFHRQEMLSSAGDTKKCKYMEGRCALSSGAYLIWTPNQDAGCPWLHWKTMVGTRMGRNWVDDFGNIALTYDKNNFVFDCSGNRLIMSHQGLPFTFLYDKASQIHLKSGQLPPDVDQDEVDIKSLPNNMKDMSQWTLDSSQISTRKTERALGPSLLTRLSAGADSQGVNASSLPDEFTPVDNSSHQAWNGTGFSFVDHPLDVVFRSRRQTNYRKRKKVIKDPGVVTAAQLAAQLQALEIKTRENIRVAFLQSVTTAC
jgi:hypothetical protein